MLSMLSLLLVAATLVLGVSGQSAASLGLSNDLVVLNYALTLENLESSFYNLALGNGGTAGVFTAANFSSSVYPANIFAMLQTIQSHENQHVAFLTGVINSASPNTAVAVCSYNFTAAMASPAAFLATAAALENGGQSAYDGAINGITSPAYAEAAATIATVEARHAAFLNELQLPLYATSPFPETNGFDTANPPATIAGVIAPFILNCPIPIVLPAVRPSGVALDSTNSVVRTGSPELSTSYTAAQQSNDLVTLNFALTLEHLEAAFYNYVNATFSAANFTSASLPCYYYSYMQMIQAHENLHVAALTAVINGRVSGAAVPACSYNFTGITTLTGPYPGSYLGVAMVLENTGVMAYDGAVNTITDTTLQQIAATIATVEARHAAFLNQAQNSTTIGAGVPFPSAYDTGMTPQAILTAVLGTGLILNCSYNITLPTVIASQATYIGSSSTGSNGAASVYQAVGFAVPAVLSLLAVAVSGSF